MGRKSYLGPAEITSFYSRDLRRHNKHNSVWLVVSTGYFYILVLWAIVLSDFLPWEIHKHLVLPLVVWVSEGSEPKPQNGKTKNFLIY